MYFLLKTTHSMENKGPPDGSGYQASGAQPTKVLWGVVDRRRYLCWVISMATRVDAHRSKHTCTTLIIYLSRETVAAVTLDAFIRSQALFRMVHSRNGDNMSNIIAKLVELKLTAKWRTSIAEYSPPPLHILCMVYALHCVCSVLCMLCTVYALHCVCSVLCMLCTVYALHCVCSVLCMLCTVYALYCV